MPVGHEIGHEIHGHGPERVMFCHGWFGGGEATFGPLLPYLDTAACTYVLVDYRGYARSIDQIGEFTMKEAAQDVIALADHLGWTHFHLVGHSMGGKVAQRVAVDAPARVKSLNAIAPVPASPLHFDADTAALFEGAVADDAKRTGIVSFSTGNRLTPVWARSLIARLARESRRDAFGAYLPSWSLDDFSAAACGLNVPLKVVVGALDPTLTRAVVEAAFGRLYPRIEYETLENAGHYPMHELPVYLATAIDAFIARHR